MFSFYVVFGIVTLGIVLLAAACVAEQQPNRSRRNRRSRR